MDAQLFNDLVVVCADGAKLRMEVGQLGAVIHQRLVHLQYLELLPEEMRHKKLSHMVAHGQIIAYIRNYF